MTVRTSLILSLMGIGASAFTPVSPPTHPIPRPSLQNAASCPALPHRQHARLAGNPLQLVASSASGGPRPVIGDNERMKDNPAPDAFFYDYPRLCYHADAEFHATLTDLYKDILPHGDEARALDMMSSWVSHYPSDRTWGRVDGLGLNREELAKNPVLDFFEVRDLNNEPSLPYDDACFDAVTCALSCQYLQQPEAVFADIARVVKPGGVVCMSFSNRMFPSKATYAWKQRSEKERTYLVADYFRSSGEFEDPEIVDKSTPAHFLSYWSASLLGVQLTGDPFYAVVARRKKASSVGG